VRHTGRIDPVSGHPITEVTRAEFDALLDYSCSLPTCTSLGKKWKRDDWSFQRKPRDLDALLNDMRRRGPLTDASVRVAQETLAEGVLWVMGYFYEDFTDDRGRERTRMGWRRLKVME